MNVGKLLEGIRTDNFNDVKELLESNEPLDIDRLDVYGNTPFSIASLLNRVRIVALLIINGADVNKGNLEGHTPLYRIIVCKHKDCLREILKSNRLDVDQDVGEGRTPLYVAAQLGFNSGVKMLLARGADVNKADCEDESPLWAASANGHLFSLKTLIRYNADVNQQDIEGMSPLHIASRNGHISSVKELIKNARIIND